ncbi:ImcF-related family protein [Kalamiella sp. sgz302252]|uniref:ImcF-related family protein n=1 Tax=Pantoea sp. sgz302252 TaxID=3341827 RepID=UPI0036D2C10B
MSAILVRFWSGWKIKKQQAIFQPETVLQVAESPSAKHLADVGDEKFKTLQRHLRHRHGLLWPYKIRLLLLTGNQEDVERLVPGLVENRWREEAGTVLLWGDAAPANTATEWLRSLRKLRRRPVDALVWVTSALTMSETLHSLDGDKRLSAQELKANSDLLQRMADTLNTRLPLFVWSLYDNGKVPAPQAGCYIADADPLPCLTSLAPALAVQGAQLAGKNRANHFLLSLAVQLRTMPQSITRPLEALAASNRPLAGLIFSAYSPAAASPASFALLNDFITALPPGLQARRNSSVWEKMLKPFAASLLLLWGLGMAMSWFLNRNLIHHALLQTRQAEEIWRKASEKQQRTPGNTQPQVRSVQQQLHDLLALQQTVAKLDYRSQHGVPWYYRFGLNQNDRLASELWPRYGQSAMLLLRNAAAARLRQQLTTLISLSPDSPQRAALISPAYDQLRLLLMLSQPVRMEPEYFTITLMKNWPHRKEVSNGFWQGNGPKMLRFYAQNLPQHPEWRLAEDKALLADVRTLLLHESGLRNSELSLYQKLLAQVVRQYPDLQLQDMTGETDASALFSTERVVPGMFTRRAWEETVAPAIEKISRERREESDWVLNEGRQQQKEQTSAEEIKERLTARYFTDFAASWLNFLNSLNLQKTTTLTETIDQLTLMADVRQSPLVALINTLGVQGRTGQQQQALSNSLVRSAKELFNSEGKPLIDAGTTESNGPLNTTFGPLLALTDRQGERGSTGLSLNAYLTRVIQLRLRLQQATGGADPQAMMQKLARTVFQGKSVDLTATRDYGSLVAASLGQEWSGFGQTVFVQPVEQAWQKVLQPAARSLNEQWRTHIVNDWQRNFGSRYPFKSASSDASLPLLAQYLNANDGRIARFLQSQLNGVLHQEGSHWVPDAVNAQGLRFDPVFLRAVNLLVGLADDVFTTGEAGLHFDLRPGTAAGVMETRLTVDGRRLFYVNQRPEWHRFAWPGDTEAPGASLSWISTRTGMRQYADHRGAWGWIRLLDSATITPYAGISNSWQLRWQTSDGLALNYTLRTESGEGPLALLKLRNFRLPTQIFLTGDEAEVATSAMNSFILDPSY